MNKLKAKMKFLINILCVFCVLCGVSLAQEKPPVPSVPRTVNVPAVKEKFLANKLRVAVIERKNVPLVTVELLVRSGANTEEREEAGLANMTASLLTKGTKTRTATQIAEGMEFLGGSIGAGAGWNSSTVTIGVTSDKLDQAMAIMADTVLRPAFAQKEIDLLKSQTLDGLNYSLKQPGFLANFVASRYSFDEHPAGGTVESINKITRKQIVDFHRLQFVPGNSVLIFSGDISPARAFALAQKFFSLWKNPKIINLMELMETPLDIPEDAPGSEKKNVKRILVIDLPNSGQASVNYTKKLDEGRVDFDGDSNKVSKIYFPSTVANSVLGGGYSSRLNQEIRIKRGLSYGAGSSFAWRFVDANFSTRTQTKNESAAEVAELVSEEIERLGKGDLPEKELTPRKLTLTGDFGRDLETTGGLAGALADLYLFELPASELNSYMSSVRAVSDDQIKGFASGNLMGGDIIIVGDAKIFMNDLKKRFSDTPITVIKADELDVSKDNLRK